MRQRRLLARISGLSLQAGAGVALFPYVAGLEPMSGQLPVLNGCYFGCALIALAGLFSSWCLRRNETRLKEWERNLMTLLGS